MNTASEFVGKLSYGKISYTVIPGSSLVIEGKISHTQIFCSFYFILLKWSLGTIQLSSTDAWMLVPGKIGFFVDINKKPVIGSSLSAIFSHLFISS